MATTDKAFQALVRKLHAAELDHLRQVVAEQQALIEAQAKQIADLQRDLSWAEGRADMFHDLVHELQDSNPNARIGLTLDGRLGVLQ